MGNPNMDQRKKNILLALVLGVLAVFFYIMSIFYLLRQ